MTTPDSAPYTTPDAPAPGSFPLLVGAQVEAYTLVVRRQTCTDLAAMLRNDGHTAAAELVEADRDFTELSRSLAAIPKTPETEHKARCRAFDCRCSCDRAQTCPDCHRCVCWRAECCAQVPTDAARRADRTAALRRLLDSVGLKMLTELRETAAQAEEAALRCTIARRIRLLEPGDDRPYTAFFAAGDFGRLGMGHADYSIHDVELYDEESGASRTVDLDDAVLSASLGTLAELLRPDDGAVLDLPVDLTTEDCASRTPAEEGGR
ncbi:hypothetical protein [Streptomyces sp. NPDC001165]|uniref:hypothetical protein n=1 Tax=Streptomyces sp. NPDC001165 TaxID=3364546 RepID=UPI0036CC793F